MTRALAIDIGNSRIKWCAVDLREPWSERIRIESVPREEGASLIDRFGALEFEGVWASNVAGHEILDAVRAAVANAKTKTVPFHLFHAATAWGPITNGYDRPESLGSDRWASILGASCAHPSRALVIISVGTATTIDCLDARGHHQGGVILPGLKLMRRALARETAQLPLARGHVHGLGTNTDDGIESGIMHAQAGAIERVLGLARRQDPDTLCLLTGGNAPLVAAHLQFEVRMEDNLVLRGLCEFARSQSASTVSP